MGYEHPMPIRTMTCIRHFHHVVTCSDGRPACRGCGLTPTPEEEAAGLEALVRWEEARVRGNVKAQRNSR